MKKVFPSCVIGSLKAESLFLIYKEFSVKRGLHSNFITAEWIINTCFHVANIMALVVTRKYKINGVSKGRQNRKKSQWLNGSQMDSKLEK